LYFFKALFVEVALFAELILSQIFVLEIFREETADHELMY